MIRGTWVSLKPRLSLPDGCQCGGPASTQRRTSRRPRRGAGARARTSRLSPSTVTLPSRRARRSRDARGSAVPTDLWDPAWNWLRLHASPEVARAAGLLKTRKNSSRTVAFYQPRLAFSKCPITATSNAKAPKNFQLRPALLPLALSQRPAKPSSRSRVFNHPARLRDQSLSRSRPAPSFTLRAA